MVKKWIKLIGVLLITLLVINIIGINNRVFAESIDVTANPDFWSNITQADTGGTFTGMMKKIISTVRYLGLIVSVIALAIIGLKFMLGSVEEKAQYKQTLFPWFIGAIMVFAITTIPTLIYNSTQNLFS